jgi:hypothetical protein
MSEPLKLGFSPDLMGAKRSRSTPLAGKRSLT